LQGGSGSESSEQTTAEFLDDLSKVVCLEVSLSDENFTTPTSDLVNT